MKAVFMASCLVAAMLSPNLRQPLAQVPSSGRESATKQLIESETSFWTSVQRQDRQMMERLMAPEYQYISYKGGSGRSRQDELTIHFSGKLRLDRFDLTHWHVVWLTDDSVMLHYMNRAVGAVEGKPIEQLGGAVATWVRRGGKWQVVARTEWKIAADEFPSSPRALQQ